MWETEYFAGKVERLPLAISGLGIFLGLVLVGEVVLYLLAYAPGYNGLIVGAVTSIPFIGCLVYGGYWLQQSQIVTEQYSRIARWWTGGMLAVTLLIVGITISMNSMRLQRLVGTIRWTVAIGGCLGLIIGVLQSRSIQRAVEIERVRLRQEETEQERDRLDEFATIVSHDLRNPLATARGYTELAREEGDPEYFERITNSLDRMERIIDDVLWLAREGREIGTREEVELAEAIDDAWDVIASDGVDAELVYDADQLGRTTADSDRLSQLLENLLGNEIKHGGPGVTVRVEPIEEGFAIADDGPGIPDSIREQVFEQGVTTAEDGTGLGLYIVNQIAEAHGWQVDVTESDSGGARIEITGVETVSAAE